MFGHANYGYMREQQSKLRKFKSRGPDKNKFRRDSSNRIIYNCPPKKKLKIRPKIAPMNSRARKLKPRKLCQ